MQKVTAFLEQHIQWIAIGLGALFVLYMTYSYVILPPAQVTVGNESFGPSEIDPHTAETVVGKLQSAMQNSQKIKMEVPQYVQAFQSTMTWQGAKPIKLEGLTDTSLTHDVPLPPKPQDPNAPQQNNGIAGGNNQQTPNPGAPGGKLTQLPVPPTPKQTDPTTFVKYGRSVVVPPPAPGQAAQVPAPGIVPPGAVDTDWVTQMWTVSMNDIDAAFRNAGVTGLPPELHKTMFLDVEMVREEMVDGQWGNSTVIQQHTPMRNNQPRQPFPGGAGNPQLRQAQFQYAAWASTSTPDIIQPLFHVTVPNKGDQWTKPGPQLMAALTFNPAEWAAKPDLTSLTKEQRDAVMQYRRDQQKILAEQKKAQRPAPGPRAPTGGGGGRGGPPDSSGEGMYAPAGRQQRSYAPARELPNFAVPPGPPRGPYGPPPRGRYGPPDVAEMDGEGGFGTYGGGGGVQVPNMPQPGTDYPAGEFDPTDTVQPQPWKGKEVEIWQHDDQVTAGKTYRYKMRYRLKNPIFSTNAGDPAALTEQFSLDSEFSDWTTPITVPSLVNFFVAGGVVQGRSTVAFEVFRWDQGQQKMERFDVAPGDQVGADRNGVSFTTDWTVVDFRVDPRANDPQILLVNNKDGSVVARSFNTDRNDRLYQALKKQVEDAKAAERAASPAAAAGGAAPGVGGTAAAR
jgi:hypothetical protein